VNDRTTHLVHDERAIHIIREDFGVHLGRSLLSRSLSEAINQFGCARTHSNIVLG